MKNQNGEAMRGAATRVLRLVIVSAVSGLVFVALQPARADEKFIIVQSTTSTQNSGLYTHILPLYAVQSSIEVRVVAVGTGQAIKNAANCDGDVLLVHSKAAEEAFVAAGYGVKRTNLMYNDFIIVGPDTDPAGVSGMKNVSEALANLAAAQAPFVSRGDNSGTHKAERRLWQAAGVAVGASSGTWYRESGSGMGATLNTAAGMGAYTLADRATWISFGNKANLKIQVRDDPRLFNQYGVILVNPARCKNVKAESGQDFIDWLLSEHGQMAIKSHKVGGKQLFFPNAPTN